MIEENELTIEEFLLARLEETKRKLMETLPTRLYLQAEVLVDNQRFLIEWHQNWPVLVETPPVMSATSMNPNSMTFSMTQQLQWMTQQEYVRVFGSQPPTAPVLRQLAAGYSWHPDYKLEWEI